MFQQSKISQKPIFQMFLGNLAKPQDSEKKLFCPITNFSRKKYSGKIIMDPGVKDFGQRNAFCVVNIIYLKRL